MKNTEKNKKQPVLQRINFNAAGIDIGSREHYVAVPVHRDENPVRAFGAFTADLHLLADWLKECKIKSIVMESTGVYWIPLFQILEAKGFEVLLVNARHAKNVPGRNKTDVSDCQWLQELHTYGLLSGSFQPESSIKILRTYLRQRDMLNDYSSSHIQHIQKALTLMNIKLHNVISDITGASGMDIVRAILQGNHNPDELVKFCRRGLKSPISIIKKSLEGYYTEENLFTLKQAVELYDYYQKKLLECEEMIQKQLSLINDKRRDNNNNSPAQKSESKNKKKRKHIKLPELKTHLDRITGVDLTAIDGLNTINVLSIISEIGTDMSKWKSEKHFTSWLGLAPNNKITGGRVISTSSKNTKSHASQAFRLSARSLHSSDSYLGAYYRRLRSRLGAPKANVAAARKLAIIVYQMMKTGQAYSDLGREHYEKKYQNRMIKNLKARATKLGFQLTPVLDVPT